MSKRLGIKYINDFIKKYNGYCVSKEYINIYCKLEFICENNHEFSLDIAQLKRGQWCPDCQVKHYKQEYCRKILEQMFACKFVKVRPTFLKGLELDGYNNILQLGFEYNGPQHYMELKIGKRVDDVIKAKKIDRKKIFLCKKNNIKLIVIPYWIQNIEKHIISECEKQNIVIINKNINIRNINIFSSSIYKKLNDYAKAHNGRILSNKCLGMNYKVKWQCAYKHIWEALPSNVLYHKNWCPYCAGNNKKTIIDAQHLADKRNGKCISEKMDGVHKKMIWQCINGHKWASTYHNIQSCNTWCPYCAKRGTNKEKYRYLNEVCII